MWDTAPHSLPASLPPNLPNQCTLDSKEQQSTCENEIGQNHKHTKQDPVLSRDFEQSGLQASQTSAQWKAPLSQEFAIYCAVECTVTIILIINPNADIEGVA